jgi:hypothetical protein
MDVLIVRISPMNKTVPDQNHPNAPAHNSTAETRASKCHFVATASTTAEMV